MSPRYITFGPPFYFANTIPIARPAACPTCRLNSCGSVIADHWSIHKNRTRTPKMAARAVFVTTRPACRDPQYAIAYRFDALRLCSPCKYCIIPSMPAFGGAFCSGWWQVLPCAWSAASAHSSGCVSGSSHGFVGSCICIMPGLAFTPVSPAGHGESCGCACIR